MRIVLDAMGSDDSPGPELQAAVEAAREFGDEIFLTGPEEQLRTRLAALAGDHSRVVIVNAPDTITMEDKGLKLALKAKRRGSQTSMAVGIDLVKEGRAEAFITAGNTGGALATAFYRLGTLANVERPARAAQRAESDSAPRDLRGWPGARRCLARPLARERFARFRAGRSSPRPPPGSRCHPPAPPG